MVFTLGLMCLAVFGAIGYLHWKLPNQYTVDREETFSLSQFYLTATTDQESVAVSATNATKDYTIKLFGLVPIKTVSVTPQDPVALIPAGTPFGVKMFTKGPMVVGFQDIATASSTVSPGEDAGLQTGDLVQTVNGKTVTRNEEVAFLLQHQGAEASVLTVLRAGELMTITLMPVLSTDGSYKSGVWIRDSAAGIGTLTFIDPESNLFGGLGHAIYDVDTGDILTVGSGEVSDVTIHHVSRGEVGIPGELQGVFTNEPAIGTIETNNETGIYGKLFDQFTQSETIPMARKQEVVLGDAQIVSTIDETGPAFYDITIKAIDYDKSAKTQNMVIEVVDPRLLDTTGGIVQGMSGSPIIQNGKLIGAVTHVFVNDPTRGYGIFIENMLESADSIGN